MRLNLSLIGWDDAFLKDDGTFMTFNNIRTDQEVSNIHEVNNNNNMRNRNKTAGGKDTKDSKQDIVAQYYYNIWEQGLASKPYIMANRGMKV